MGSFERVVWQEEMEILGFPAWRRDVVPAEGVDSRSAYEYFINLTPSEPCETGRWFIGRTESDDPGDFAENKAILDEMMSSLRLADGE